MHAVVADVLLPKPSQASVCLVYPPFYNETIHCVPPIGILRIASLLESEGISVTVLDFIYKVNSGEVELSPQILDECATQIVREGKPIVGFSTQCTTLPPSIGIAERIKRLAPETLVVFGGYGVSFESQKILEAFPCVDLIVNGEGEQTLLDIVRMVDRGDFTFATVAGVTFRDSHGQARTTMQRPLLADLDALPLPAYHLVPSPREYKAVSRDKQQANQPFPIDAGRGCSFTCNFCSSCLMFNRKVRIRSASNIVSELTFLRRIHGVDHFLLTYDLFNVNRRAVVEFCEAVLAAELDIQWECRCRLDLLDREVLELMRRSGCANVLIGIESGSAKTLGYIRKPMRRINVQSQIVMVIESGVSPIFSFIVGFPNETPEDIAETLKLALFCRLHEPSSTTLHLATPLPGTDLYKDSLPFLQLKYMTGDLSSGIEFSKGDYLQEDLRRISNHPDIFSSFYNIAAPGLDLVDLFFVYRTWNPLISFCCRSLYLLSAYSGLDYWVLLQRFKEDADSALLQSIENVAKCLDWGAILSEYWKFARHQTVGLPMGRRRQLEDYLALEEAVSKAAVFDARSPLSAKHAELDSSDVLKLREGVFTVQTTTSLELYGPPILDPVEETNAACHVAIAGSGFLYKVIRVDVLLHQILGRCDGRSTIAQVLKACFGSRGRRLYEEGLRDILMNLRELGVFDADSSFGQVAPRRKVSRSMASESARC
ncbi:B12-binding domain-containing radical SAM protein [Paraburkholderia mimosarum]|uniref:B12-binding domain-containing radical SAM protein n=1 Tax=Paraburkholderia mimosarum TaxID=312026 RepID=UPI000406B355|nr:radical SAM protein [Paraburkholderia mimosarum]